jgi:hypothetical protein
MKTHRTTRIAALAALLALCMAGEALWAQSSGWPAWQGKANADKKEWDEMGTWYTDTWNYFMDAYKESPIVLFKGGRAIREKDRDLLRMVDQLLKFTQGKQKDGVKFWKKDKARYQAALTAAQQVLQAQQAAETAKQQAAEQAAAAKKAEAERKAQERAAAEQKAVEEKAAAIAAANAKGVTEADFEYDVTQDGRGIVIEHYRGIATEVKIPAVIEGFPVKELEADVFQRNTGITSVIIPDSVTAIESKTFDKWNQTSNFGAFEGCTSLKIVTLPKTLKTIPKQMFAGCTSLESIAIPNGVTAIDEEAFAGCTSLKNVTLPGSVTVISRFAFWNCKSLAAITLPDSLASIGLGAFMRTGLTNIVLPKNLTTLEGGSFYNEDEFPYRAFKGRDNSFLYGGVFEDCVKLEIVTINGSGVNLVRSFYGCSALTTLTINGNINLEMMYEGPDNVGVFAGCHNLTTVNIGPKVTKIGNVDQLSNAGKLSIASKAALNKLR